MPTPDTITLLSNLPVRADAKRCVSWLPLNGIYWDDELPDSLAYRHLPKSVRDQILRLFKIRNVLWKHAPLDSADQQFWEDAVRQAPHYALFQRLNPSDEDLRAHQKVQQDCDSALNDLIAEAKVVSVTRSPGVESFGLTFPLTKSGATIPKSSWWKRLFHS